MVHLKNYRGVKKSGKIMNVLGKVQEDEKSLLKKFGAKIIFPSWS